MTLERTVSETDASDRDELDMILDRRRQAGAQVVEVETAKVKLVIFVVGEALLAFPARGLVEILPLTTIHVVPGCPPALEGVINVRGDIASVVRLGDLLGMTHAPSDRRSAILLGQGTQMRSGLRVDRVVDVLDVPEESIQAPPQSLPEPLRGPATGVFEHEGQIVILLDLDRVFQALLRE
ncbi:chemotaxis protein CheW [Thiocapsa rosea]|uniref:Purine-binding chemotaxis protein CheW n=1 Tax=Thiocapsa rosea TaxID=69360 RepID=A0A495VAI7_9GAMM|nr:chemotaxis protein CheW [Thiocapsa rosea]RKT44798.1 purine-binding chemotaxis protein CheW [Thiocapsa rosea]